MSRNRIVAALAGALVLASPAALAGARKGLTFGVGTGAGLTRGPLPGQDPPGPSNTYFSFAFPQFSLGYAPTDQLDIHFATKFSAYDLNGMGDDYRSFNNLISEGLGVLLLPVAPIVWVFIPLLHSHILIGPGATYYLRPEAPSVFFEAAGGPTPYAGGPVLGLFGGAGYEFGRNTALELGVMWGAASLSKGLIGSDLLSVSLTFNVLAY